MILIIHCGSQKTPYIEQAVDLEMEFETVGIHDVTREHLANKLGIILSGAPILLTEVDATPYLQRIAWLKDLDLPVWGICFGHQLIGLLHGAMVSRQREDRDWQTIELIADCPLFDKLPPAFEMMEDHCESVSVPAEFELVAVSDTCVNEAMMHKSKPVFGVQFHPEVSGNHGTILFENFVHICRSHAAKATD